jgi:hypothetical protein
MKLKVLIIILWLAIIGCKEQIKKEISTRNQKPLIEKNITDPIERENTLFVFVGEKIDVSEIPVREGSIDFGFKAKYKVLLKVYGNYSRDTIDFIGYDHYGFPRFAKFKDVLLFVSNDSGRLYHEKYMFHDVYKTKDGRWAGPYDISDYGHPFIEAIDIKPEIIEFQDQVSYPIGGLQQEYRKLRYPEPYFKITDSSAVAIYGNYLNDLFMLKKRTVLTARGLFSGKKEIEKRLKELDSLTIKK